MNKNDSLFWKLVHKHQVRLVHEFVQEHNGNQSAAARHLGLNRATLRKLLKEPKPEEIHEP